MKWLVSILIVSCFLYANEKSDKIKNDTKVDMLCVENYPSVYEKKDVNGKQKTIKVFDNEEYINTLKPNKTIKKKREGELTCYNEYKLITSPKNNSVFQTNKNTLDSYLLKHNRYDLTFYENKTRDFLDKNLGLPQRCAPYKQSQYCNYWFGFDILFDKNKKVKTIFLYDNSVNRGKLPFSENSILNL